MALQEFGSNIKHITLTHSRPKVFMPACGILWQYQHRCAAAATAAIAAAATAATVPCRQQHLPSFA